MSKYDSMYEVLRDASRRELENLYERKKDTWEAINGLREKLSGVNAYLRDYISEIKTMRGPGWAEARASKQAEIDELKREKEDLQEELNEALRELSDIKDEIQSIKDQYD